MLATRLHLCLIITVSLLSLLAVGCSRRADTDNGKPKIVLVMKSLANEFFKTMEEGATAHQRAHSDVYDLKVVGIRNEEDVAQQVDLVEMIIAQGADAIVIAPADSEALIPICKKAIAAGIVVVNIDNKLDRDRLEAEGIQIPFVGPDNRKGAKLAGDYLATKLKAGDEVAIIEGIPNAFNGIQRKAGFEDAIKDANLKLVSSQSGNWETDKAAQCVAAIATEYPNLKAVLCANDSMALGAVDALKAAGKSNVYVVGFDNIQAVQKLIKEGKVLCTVDQHGDQLAVYGIQYALEILDTKAAPADKETPIDLITAETLK
ncbi:MAG TPA: sugar ABC transporter substrate-binding protein [Anaerohalosphaeraceae bacterium]|nr:sugar ABC transporter substrate-binding protein [Anaerohalosphaeraceae bacterium]HRT51996.1 sugar ABC transporter substrate-binding protein [Anaerohalosphaeraceae bacterium]HRT88059.1 sugar ABC transporter substrate-binding protein [Anaerohalosphaeraceae bacterium]